MTKRDHPDARPPVPMPDELAYLWRWFWEINHGRTFTGTGTPLPVAPSEILAWCTLRGMRMDDWELTVIQGLDAAFLKAANRKS